MCGLAMAGPGLRPQRSWRTCSTIHGQETRGYSADHRECQAHFVRAFCVDFLWMCLNLCLTCACQHHSVRSHLLCGLLDPLPVAALSGALPVKCSRVSVVRRGEGYMSPRPDAFSITAQMLEEGEVELLTELLVRVLSDYASAGAKL